MKAHQPTSGFAKLGGGVTTQTVAGTKTAGVNPDGVRLHPQLRKAAVSLEAMRASAVPFGSEKRQRNKDK